MMHRWCTEDALRMHWWYTDDDDDDDDKDDDEDDGGDGDVDDDVDGDGVVQSKGAPPTQTTKSLPAG